MPLTDSSQVPRELELKSRLQAVCLTLEIVGDCLRKRTPSCEQQEILVSQHWNENDVVAEGFAACADIVDVPFSVAREIHHEHAPSRQLCGRSRIELGLWQRRRDTFGIERVHEHYVDLV